MDNKIDPTTLTALPFDDDLSPAELISPEKAGTFQDQQDMSRMGKLQELRRNFRFISVVGFTAVLMCSWEAILFTASYILPNGGLAGMVYMYIVSLFGFGFAILSMAEMASISPTSGGQYHWVSEFSPASAQKFLSFMTGWLCVLGWQVNIASGGYLVALEIQGLISLNDATYVAQPWHGTLLIIAVGVCAIVFNTLFARKLPLIEVLMLVLHVLGFFAVLITLWVGSEPKSATTVFTDFSQINGWPSIGLACLVGMTGPIYSLLGPDSAVHMSEEIRDASRTLPVAMLWALLLNGTTGLIMVITFAFCLGNLHAALYPAYNFAFIEVFYNATNSHAGATVLTAIIIIMTLCSTISNVATASRQIFAFARDGGVPFGKFLSRVRPGWDIPLNAVLVSFIVTCLLSLINLGSAVAFNAIVSLSVGSLLTSYIISISCICIKRMRGQYLGEPRWTLGKWGNLVNIIALCYLVLAYVFTFFPLGIPVSPATMNWSSLIYGSVIIFSLSYYFLYARKIYQGPVVHVKRMS